MSEMKTGDKLQIHWERYTEGKQDFKDELHEFCEAHDYKGKRLTFRQLSLIMAEDADERFASINSELSRGNLSQERLNSLKKVLTKIEEAG